MLHAVDGVNFSIERGKTLGIVGESGCGKTTLGRTILRLVEPTSGSIVLDGKDITKCSRREMKKIRKDLQIIFQDPFSSLDPRNT
ncbi:MAG: ATP-binding cassette domain-containing protein, partial [Spirochaetales bacterium]|nr:ATP-binding cassette domain-containing protein [Spirochaetales bacterium]